MMLPTHILIGLSLITPIVYILPDELLFPLAIGVVVGSTIPDLDLLYGTHRKTLHSPVISWLFVGITSIFLVLFPTPVTAAVSAFCFGISQHSLSDVFGGGLEYKPWEKTSEKAVYSHRHKEWWKPRHYASYDGSPRDLAVFSTLAIISHFTFSEIQYYSYFIAILGLIALTYTVSRKILPKLDAYLYKNVPAIRPFLQVFDDENRRNKEY